MVIYFSGIGGVGIGPLAEIAHDAGYRVIGSDVSESLMTTQLQERGIEVELSQDGSFLASVHEAETVDWFVYTAGLPDDHPELIFARSRGIRTAKRDELLSHTLREKGLKLLAVSGTSGKTTTTGMLVWALQQLNIPVSYSIGTTLSYGPSGKYDPKSEYFVYECDEFDRNMLHFHPHVALITSLGYDHSDTYETRDDYLQAFSKFVAQSEHTIGWAGDLGKLDVENNSAAWQLQTNEVADLALAGEHNRRNATLVLKTCEYLGIAASNNTLASFPGTNRRFEKLGDNLYSDYGHHPIEIAATLQMANEVDSNVVLVYQPHQNTRQHEVRSQYANCFKHAAKVYWLPTYLSREDPDLEILSPEVVSENVKNKEVISYADLDDALWRNIQNHRANGDLVLCMGAGSIDRWVRDKAQDL